MTRGLLAGLLVMVTAGLVAGFSVVGGPNWARMEQDDTQRAQDLRNLARYHLCLFKKPATPDPSTARSSCENFRSHPGLTDPATGQAYEFRETDADFSVCARFQTQIIQRRSRRPANFDVTFDADAVQASEVAGQVGCIKRLKPS